MKKLTLLLAVMAVLVSSAGAAIDRTPTSSLLWNHFNSVSVVDSFAIATATDGLVALKYEPQSGMYQPLRHAFLDSEPLTQKRNGNVLTVRTTADELYFYDLTALPELRQLGRIDVGVQFADFTLRGNYLYLAAGFKGLWRYRLNNYQSSQFVDSSMLGVHYVKCEAYNDALLALDDYNGILRYSLSGDGFGTFVDYLYIPFQANSFCRKDSTVYVSLDAMMLYEAKLTDQRFSITDSVTLLAPANRLFITDTMVMALNFEFLMDQAISRNSKQVSQGFPQFNPDPRFDGDVFRRNDAWMMMVPSADGGLLEYDLGIIAYNTFPHKVLPRPGPITGLNFHNGLLYTCGRQNPLDIYRIEPSGEALLDEIFLPGFNDVVAMANRDDLFAVAYQQNGSVFLLDPSGDEIQLIGSTPYGKDTVRAIYFGAAKIDTLRSMFLYGGSTIGIYAISDSNVILQAGKHTTLGAIMGLAVVDSILAVTTNKGMWLYRIYNDFNLEYRSYIMLSELCYNLCPFKGRLLAFDNSGIVVFNLANPFFPTVDTTIHTSLPVMASVMDGQRMYTVGSMGIGVFDVSGQYPLLLDQGGRPGTMIAAESGMVAISDGNSINLFRVENPATDIADGSGEYPASYALHQNYPNPFNPSTTIEYSLPTRARVRLAVFNMLGQEVTCLVNIDQEAGSHSVEWGGTDSFGQQVATGVYLYRISTAHYTETRKMLLLK